MIVEEGSWKVAQTIEAISLQNIIYFCHLLRLAPRRAVCTDAADTGVIRLPVLELEAGMSGKYW